MRRAKGLEAAIERRIRQDFADWRVVTRMRTISRVHVAGGSGTGKTTLARDLAQLLGVEMYELDTFGYRGGAGERVPLHERLQLVASVASGPSWVTEGMFLWWIDELLKRADLIVWLDLPWRTATFRLMKRYMRDQLSGEDRHGGWIFKVRYLWAIRGDYFQGILEFPRTLDDDYALSRPTTANHLLSFKTKVAWCRSPIDVENLFRYLQERVAAETT